MAIRAHARRMAIRAHARGMANSCQRKHTVFLPVYCPDGIQAELPLKTYHRVALS